MITENDIVYLFDVLWPKMKCSTEHKKNCLEILEQINNCFTKYSNHDQLIKELMKFDGIKITIASGLIWSVYREDRVPFDKITLGYALYKKILLLDNVSTNYIKYSRKIKDYCDGQPLIQGRQYLIKDFVIEANEECDKLLYHEPK